MKDIKVYEFKELNKEAQLKAVRKAQDSINKECLVYIKEIYTDYIESMMDILMPEVSVSIILTYDDFSISISGNKRPYTQRGADARAYFDQKIAELKDKNSWFADEFGYFVMEYDKDSYDYCFIVIQSFLNDIAIKTLAWLFKMRFDTDYAVNYILGNDDCCWACPDVFFDGQYFFEDGKAYHL